METRSQPSNIDGGETSCVTGGASIPLCRLSTPLDVASAAPWLASDEAAFITGVALEVDDVRCN